MGGVGLKRAIIGLLLGIIIITGLVLIVPEPAETCITGRVMVVNEFGGVVVIGDQGICGANLHWSTVVGPSVISPKGPIY